MRQVRYDSVRLMVMVIALFLGCGIRVAPLGLGSEAGGPRCPFGAGKIVLSALRQRDILHVFETPSERVFYRVQGDN